MLLAWMSFVNDFAVSVADVTVFEGGKRCCQLCGMLMILRFCVVAIIATVFCQSGSNKACLIQLVTIHNLVAYESNPQRLRVALSAQQVISRANLSHWL